MITSQLQFEAFIIVGENFNLARLKETAEIFWTENEAKERIEELKLLQDGKFEIYPVMVALNCLPMEIRNFSLIKPQNQQIETFDIPRPEVLRNFRRANRGNQRNIEDEMNEVERDWARNNGEAVGEARAARLEREPRQRAIEDILQQPIRDFPANNVIGQVDFRDEEDEVDLEPLFPIPHDANDENF